MLKFLGKKIREIFGNKGGKEALADLEEIFYRADLGTQLSQELCQYVSDLVKKEGMTPPQQVIERCKAYLLHRFPPTTPPPLLTPPHVILVVGVNGNGKTTSVAKLAYLFKKQGKSVLIAAADTFRAAAVEQLEKWAEKLAVPLVKGKMGSDPAAVAFDALAAAKSRGHDIVLVDTAGRLHTKTDLMQELQKIKKVCAKAIPGAPHDTLLVLDATIGQNGIEQASLFHKYTPLTGLILTKLDGSARGGVVCAIQAALQVPVTYVGTGENIEALTVFQPTLFLDALFAD